MLANFIKPSVEHFVFMLEYLLLLYLMGSVYICDTRISKTFQTRFDRPWFTSGRVQYLQSKVFFLSEGS